MGKPVVWGTPSLSNSTWRNNHILVTLNLANPHSNYQQTIQSLREASAIEEGTIEAQLGCGSVREPRAQRHLRDQTRGIAKYQTYCHLVI
jgi:hypothetical protein